MSESPHSAEFARLERLFSEAVELTPDAREGMLARLRATEPALAERLDALLAADRSGDDTMRAVVASAARALHAEAPFVGDRFGVYRTERVIGYGGMGAVYLGRRDDGAFEQAVAIKTIIAGLASPATLERFRREREILAQLNHAGITRLLDGGAGPDGVPFVAMELVDGVPITKYVADRRADLRVRLELFLELCDAVEFVHRHLIVHRDIKPGNVFVTTDGHVKLLDFGIAKLSDELDHEASLTHTATRVMTPAYASPEQILGQPVTTAADIYALGVLLYELVAGVHPTRGDATSPLEVARQIVTVTPEFPSEAARRASADGQTRNFARRLRGDLDRIILMALRKEPSRRYGSVDALAADLRAWLAGRPVAAQADTWRYRTRKLVERHPAASVATVLAVAVVVGFTGVTVWQNRAIQRERDIAVESAARATATSDFLVNLFAAADPRQPGTRNMTAFELLKSGVDALRTNTTLDPDVRSDLYLTLGLSLSNLEAFDEGIDSLRASLAISERTHGRDSLETAERLHRLGDVLRRVKRYDEALADLTEALEIRRRHAQGDSYEIADSYNNLAILAADMGDPVKSERLQIESLAMHARVAGDSPMPGVPLNNLALLRRRQGRYGEALDLATRAVGLLRVTGDRDSTWWAERTIARIRQNTGHVDDAQRLFESVRREAVAELGPDHSRIISLDLDIAGCLVSQGDYQRAAQMYEDIERRIRRVLGDRSAPLALVLRDRGLLDRRQGRLAAAVPLLREALARETEAEGPRHFRVPSFRRALADALDDTGQLAEAERLLRESVARLPDPAVYPHVELARTLTSLARTLRLEGRREEARAAIDRALDIIRRTAGKDSLEMNSTAAEARQIDPEGAFSGGPPA